MHAHPSYMRRAHAPTTNGYIACMHAQILQFSFAMPPAGAMGALERWMLAVMAFTDTVGQYKLRPEQKVRNYLNMSEGYGRQCMHAL